MLQVYHSKSFEPLTYFHIMLPSFQLILKYVCYFLMHIHRINNQQSIEKKLISFWQCIIQNHFPDILS